MSLSPRRRPSSSTEPSNRTALRHSKGLCTIRSHARTSKPAPRPLRGQPETSTIGQSYRSLGVVKN
jgi:hypothetical protein